MTALAPGPLQGVKVLDFTQMLSGPFCTMLLTDLGADVLKIEPITGDPVRTAAPMFPGDTLKAYGGYFQSINRGKRSIAIDLKSPDGIQLVEELAASADVVVENFKVGVMDRLGLSYEHLHEINPRLVYACIRGFGDPRTGESPYAQWPAFDVVAQSMGGLMSMTGPGPGQPMKVGASVGDIVPGMMAALGIVSAVVHSTKTGQGQFLDVAMYDTIFAICEQIMYRYSYLGEVAEPQGNTHPFLCPFDVFPATDGAVTIAAPLDHIWRELCQLIGRDDLAADERLAHQNGRSRNGPEVREAIGAWTSSRTKAEIVAALGGHIPCGPVNTIEDIINDPHMAARHMIASIDQPGVDRQVQVPGSPIKLTETPAGVRGRAPLVGEQTREVLSGLGYTNERIAALESSGAVRTTEALL